jgi:hypothetical protein
MFQRWMCALAAAWIAFGAVGAAQDRATVQMRDGSKFEGRIEELTASGELFVRVSQHDQRRVPVTSVALIDKVGGASGLPNTEVREATGSEHLLLLTNGSSVKGHLVAIRGGEGSANENLPRTYVFRAAGGGEQNYAPEQVSRVYLGAYPFAATAGTGAPNPRRRTRPSGGSDLEPGVDTPGALHVAAAAGWVSTGMPVRKGEWISFSTTGEVQLSANPSDRAHAAGTTRSAPGAPLPTVNAGALIGRVGNSQPFGIGDQAAVPMPFDGVLFLAVNDDERSDNAGEFIVSIRRGR